MSSQDLYALMRGRQREVPAGAVHAVPFLASLALPPKALVVGAGAIAFVGVLAFTAKWASIPPIDVSWLFYTNFVIVYGLQVAPVLIYGAFALRRLRRSPHHPPTVRFLCLVTAYHEEAVIRNSVGTLTQQAYPKHLYEVYVVSDGRGDRTEEITEALGARVFRTGTGGIGKHRALGVAFAQLLTGEDDERYVCVIDADNRVAANYLQEMNNAICERGDRCLQSFHDVLNGSDNWITKSHWLNGVASSQLYNPGRF